MSTPARLVAAVALLALAAGGCGGESIRLSLDDYVAMQQAMTDELEAMGEGLVVQLVEVIDLEAGTITDPSGLQEALGGVAATLGDYHARLTALEPPESLQSAHDAFVAAAGDRLSQWQDVAAGALDIESLEALEVLTDKSLSFFNACVALEAAVADQGQVLDLDCD